MRALLPLLLLLLGACGDRRSFDERFNDPQAELEQRSAELDRKLEEEQALSNEPPRAAPPR